MTAMDHDAAREQLELAALEPAGIDRLMAGDTATAQAVAAHLAGCPECSDELARLEPASRLIAAVIREAPPAGLRDRTVATVRALGRPRGVLIPAAAAGPASSERSAATSPTPVAVMPLAGRASSAGRRRAVIGWVAVIAAAVVLSVATTSIVVGSRVDQRLAAQTDTIGVLEEVTIATLRVTAAPDARHVALAGTSDPSLNGTLVFSPSTAELVVVATGLKQPPDGQEYRCWVERAGQRKPVGKMFFSDELSYWIGPVPALSGVSSGATFGVSLVDASGAPVDATPVLVGRSLTRAGQSGRPLGQRRRRPSTAGLDQPVLDQPILDGLIGDDVVRRWGAEIRSMEDEQPLGRLGAHLESILGHDQRQPGRLARPLRRRRSPPRGGASP